VTAHATGRRLRIIAAGVACCGGVLGAPDRIASGAPPAAVAIPVQSMAGPSDAVARRLALVRGGEAALALGRVGAAIDAVDSAAALSHDADTELSQVRATLQAGAYRRALAFCAHAAGAHPDEAGGTALYAWLLHLGGQSGFARRVLDLHDTARGADPSTDAVRSALAGETSRVRSMRNPPVRLAPYATGPVPPAGSRVVATATRLGNAALAIAPAAAVSGMTALWVRDGLGRTSAAALERSAEVAGLVVLRLEQPPVIPPDDHLAPARPPFPGSIAYAASFMPEADDAPAWPGLVAGFLGAPTGSDRVLRLDAEAPPGSAGGPVFDASGRLIGVTSIDRTQGFNFVPIATLNDGAQLVPAGAPPTAPGGHLPPDAIYERALPLTLQLIALP
jgi:hypothetical protein